MSPTYTITVKNQSGRPQSYALFSETPQVSGDRSGEIWASVLEASSMLPPGSMMQFAVTQEYFVFSGNYQGFPGHGSRVDIAQTQHVELGRAGANGSTVKLNVRAGGDDVRLDPAQTPGDGNQGAIAIDTGNAEFTLQDANNINLAVGIASASLNGGYRALASFTPVPNVRYNIKPSGVYHVAFGERLQTGQLVQPQMIYQSARVDFSRAPSVSLVHDPSGQLRSA